MSAPTLQQSPIPADPLRPGERLGQYEIIDKLGAGGMGVVYRAEDTRLQRQIALKLLPQHLAENPAYLARFEREVLTAAAINHPNIVTIHSVEEVDAWRFITMEWVDGQSLSRSIPDGGMRLEEFLDLAEPLAKALNAAHKLDIIHRDLKPGNIMLTRDRRIKILDFGLAKYLPGARDEEKEGPTQPLTAEGSLMGTLQYMSPEQMHGEELDARSDLFSLGIIFYEMATGRRPFRGKSAKLMLSILQDDYPPLRQLRPDFPEELERIIDWCLQKKAADRCPSAEHLCRAMDGLRRVSSSFAPQTQVFAEAPSSDVLPTQVLPSEDETASRTSATMPAFDVPDSTIPTVEAPPTAGAARRNSAVLIAGAGFFVVALLAFFLYDRSIEVAPAVAESSGAEAVAVEEAALQRVAVLPFENLGPAEDAYFAAGFTAEVSSRLGALSGMEVIAQRSVQAYAGSDKSVEDIAAELGVDYVLSGTVQWSHRGDVPRMRITPQLIRCEDAVQVWGNAYDRVIDDVFAIQSEISGKVVEKLGVELGAADQRTVADQSTSDLAAYQAYLLGLFYAGLPDFTDRNWRLVIESFERATASDPEFAEAWAQLSKAHSMLYHLRHDKSPERQAAARTAATRAIELDPELPSAHLAFGYYHYWTRKDYEPALESFRRVVDMRPDAEVYSAIAYVERRQGRGEEAWLHLQQALETNPRDPALFAHLGETAMWMRRYRDAIESYDRAIELAPYLPWPHWLVAHTHWLWTGSTEKAGAALDGLPEHGDARIYWYLYRQAVYEGDFERALKEIRKFPEDWVRTTDLVSPVALPVAWVRRWQGDDAAAQAAFAESLDELREFGAAESRDPRVAVALGMTLAGLGRAEEAQAEGRRAMELYPLGNDYFEGPSYLEYMAFIHVLAGDHAAAVAQLEELLTIPSRVSVPLLQIDPRWDDLRALEEFQQLLERFE